MKSRISGQTEFTDTGPAESAYFAPGRTAIMIDGGSLHFALQTLGANLDYKLLLGLFAGDRPLIRAFYYALTRREAPDGAYRLLDWLDYNGYVVREKIGRELHGADGQRPLRGRVSLEMAVDALEMAPLVDNLVLFAGDGDLAALVSAVQRKGVYVTAVSTLQSRPPMIAAELRRSVDRFIDLRELVPLLGRDRPSVAVGQTDQPGGLSG